MNKEEALAELGRIGVITHGDEMQALIVKCLAELLPEKKQEAEKNVRIVEDKTNARKNRPV